MALTPYRHLEHEFRRLHAFRTAASILRWDCAVSLPRGSAALRGEQLAALETHCHTILTSPRVSRLLERAEANAQGLDEWQLANLREMRREREHAFATPQNLVAQLARATVRAQVCWLEARQKKDFSVLAPALEEVVNLTRDKAALLGNALGLNPYDALLDELSPKLTSQEIDTLLMPIVRRLPGLIQEIIDCQAVRQPLELTEHIAPAKQKELAVQLMKAMGFPFDRGRLDEAEYPLTSGAPDDLRLTSHFVGGQLLSGVVSVLHGMGHAMYSLGLPEAWRDQPVGREAGVAVRESQSSLLAMMIGRSQAFLQYLQPHLERIAGVSGPEWRVDNLYRALTRVRRSPVRAEADEVSYIVHLVLRYELEREILAGEIRITDLPEAWNARIDARLGARPANDAEGCLQDVHWPLGLFGYFPSCAIGAVMAAQLYETLRSEYPELDREIAAGHFSGLSVWLRENIHGHGARLSMAELIENATDKPLTSAAWLRYVEGKYLGE
ncbi:MAG: carboxypeptidase M32 [Gammaproteobacteria bacterium]|nr:carboxypeptidase M32 [Gammaproteobacteria bacterium]